MRWLICSLIYGKGVQTMTVIIVSKVSWNIKTVRNVTSITLSNNTYTVVGDTTETAAEANYFIRIME